jgi:tripartite-type tricarboxylate transporter receptor subunit TctC
MAGKLSLGKLGVAIGAMVATAMLLGNPATALAQVSYPSKAVKLVVTYPPGGTSDIVGRALAQAMTARLNQSFIVENRAGAGGQIGTEAVAKAPPDGYTLLIAASGPIAYLPALARKLPYDVQRDFETVANIVTVPNLMVVSAAMEIRSIADLVKFAKQNPAKVHFGSAGIGSSGHISGELFNILADVKMVHVPYRGSGPALVGLVSGEITVMFENLPSALGQVRGGKLRGVAVLSRKRSPSAPDFPTTAELGMPDLEIASSTGVLAPKGTPAEVVRILEATIRGIATDAEMTKTFRSFGADVDYMDAAQYRAYINDEVKRWTAVGQKARINLD